MSFLGNWCPEKEQPIKYCSKQLFGRGPIEKCTTNKTDFCWKDSKDRQAPIQHSGNLTFSNMPLEGKCITKFAIFRNWGSLSKIF